jgi:GT2 family glycosyltransferase
MDQRIAVVIATRNRRRGLLDTLERLEALPEEPEVIVIDNGSQDGTPSAVREAHPRAQVVPLERNLGAAARTIGVEQTRRPYVAFADDDSWWAPGSLGLAADLFDAHPDLGLANARLLVGAERRLDPTCAEMAESPLELPTEVGTPVLGFLACAAVVRRRAFLGTGGFDPRFGVGGEEEVVAIDLADMGWRLAYVEDVVAHHDPSPVRDHVGRRRVQTRNALWATWLRYPAGPAVRRTLRLAWSSALDPAARMGVREAVRGVGWAMANRRTPASPVSDALRLLTA